ncbi:glycosyltransferase family 2 protein [Tatumella ptyseos]|uniref:glycosyltransferase family 2 protein n=1 Tax=Tatumella ptyseos TaxID=82987 RepID=UPI0026EA45FB|nr:glycosyltransferase family 2 protein [Tatumella ptyseos]WKX27170.1 glycosyltransferase family 2 protein [Tatumella ptyseos]
MSENFKVIALVVVKNEGDIITETITSASQWADKIIILDNNSDDDTFIKLKLLEKKYPNVILWGRYDGKFNEGLRQILYRDFRHLANENDWWCRLDGDEFYIDNPKEYIKKLSKHTDHIYNASFQYYYTNENYINDKSSKVGLTTLDSLKWYKCNHSEIRFVKNKKTLCWVQGEGWPSNLLFADNKRIKLKHFQYRSLEQIKRRIQTRSTTESGDAFKHEIVSLDEWYKRRGFSKPSDDKLMLYNIVDVSELDSSPTYNYNDNELPRIVGFSYKKALKCTIVYIYMKTLNKLLFRI